MAKSNSKNAIVNGNFDLADASGRPTGWTLTANAEQNSKVVQEGSNHVLRMAAGAIEYTSISQVVPLPPRAKSVTISGRIRGKWETHDTTHQDWGASIYAVNVGADSAPFGDWIGLNGGREAGWRSQSQSAKIAAGSKGIRVECTLKFISGTFDFDDINVEFH